MISSRDGGVKAVQIATSHSLDSLIIYGAWSMTIQPLHQSHGSTKIHPKTSLSFQLKHILTHAFLSFLTEALFHIF